MKKIIPLSFLFSLPYLALATDDFNDFLKMDICVNSHGEFTNEVPGVDGCMMRKEAGVNSVPKYLLQLHGADRDFSSCEKRDGWMRKINVPVTVGGKFRIASYFDKGYAEGCNKSGTRPKFNFGSMNDDGDKISIYSSDKNWSSIYVSTSNEGDTFYHTPESSKYQDRSEQFKNGWILAPRILPPRKSDGSATVGGKLFDVRSYSSNPSAVFNVFPDRYNKALTLWARADFTYKNGSTLDTVVSFHYSMDNANTKLHPGRSASVEKLYFTDEYGLVRWEVWKSEDWPEYDPKEAARNYYATKRGRCSPPLDLPYKATSDMVTGPMQENSSGFHEVVRKAGDMKSRKIWYMVDCFEYTNIKSAPEGYRPDISHILSSEVMSYFFR